MRRSALFIVGVVTLLAILAFVLWERAGPGAPASENTQQQLALGKVIYDQHCASCHGSHLEGQPNWRERQPNGRLPAPPHDASGHTWHHPDSVLFGITKNGLDPYAPAGYESDMPAFAEKLADQQIEAVLAYIKSTWSPDIQARQAAITEQSKKRQQ